MGFHRGIRGVALCVALLVGGAAPLVGQGLSPVGKWRTVDDRTHQEKSTVRLTEVNGEVQGTVEVVFSPPSPNTHPICENCPGAFRDKPIVGMRIIWGLRKDGDEYTGGQVFDPDNKKTYRCKLRLVDGGKKLELRGFIGFALIGRTQTWVREPS